MSKKLQVLIGSVLILGLAVLFGCASVQDVVTPCWIPPGAAEYADANTTSILPYTTLFDAKRVQAKMNYVHTVNQVKDKLEYEYYTGIQTFHMGAAKEFQAAIFSPTGPIGLLFPTIMAGSFGALFIKRPGDKSKKEVELEENNKKA